MIWVCGASGQLGRALIESSISSGSDVMATGHELDIADIDTVHAFCKRNRPSVIVNAAAFTNVERAERDPEMAQRANFESVVNLCRNAKEFGCRMVHFSTDFVFDGDKEVPYQEQDLPRPINMYGKSKLFGEEPVLQLGALGLVFRTSWLYGKTKTNFILKIWKQLGGSDSVRVVCDQVGTPNDCAWISDIVLKVLHSPDGLFGLYHLSAKGFASRYEVAQLIREEFARRERVRTPPDIIACSSKEFPSSVARPSFSALDSSRLESALNMEFPNWRFCLDRYLASLDK